MLTNKQILGIRFAKAEDGTLIDFANCNKVAEIEEPYKSLLESSALLYQTLHFQKVAVQQLIEQCKLLNAVDIIPTFEELISNINLTMTIAETGPEQFNKETRQ